jgi:integrase
VARRVHAGLHRDGKRTRRKAIGKTKAAVLDKLRQLHHELDKGIVPKTGYANYTVRQAANDWLANGLEGRSAKTVTKNQNVLEPILTVIGARKLRQLTAGDVRQALSKMATGYSGAAVTMGHLALKRAIRHAEANDLVSRNVATLVDTPKGQAGRPSKSLTLQQAVAVITAAETLPVMELLPGLKDVRRPTALMYAYIVLSLLVGVRTEEARALRWDHVDLGGDPHAAIRNMPLLVRSRTARACGAARVRAGGPRRGQERVGGLGEGDGTATDRGHLAGLGPPTAPGHRHGHWLPCPAHRSLRNFKVVPPSLLGGTRPSSARSSRRPDAIPAVGVLLVGQVLIEHDRDRSRCHTASSRPG